MSTFEIDNGELLLNGDPVRWPVKLYDEQGFYGADAERFGRHLHKGFHFYFENGWMLSVQWGQYNYCQNYSIHHHDEKDFFEPKTTDAEIAIMSDEWIGFPYSLDGDDDEYVETVMGYVPVDIIVDFIIPTLMTFPQHPTAEQQRELGSTIRLEMEAAMLT